MPRFSLPNRFRRTAVVALAAALGAGLMAPTTATAASASRPIIFGASAYSKDQVLDNERALGRHLRGVRTYKRWDMSPLFGANEQWMKATGHIPFMSVQAQRRNGTHIKFRDIANARPGSALHNDIVRQAREAKAFGAKVYYTFHHEPETKWSTMHGDGDDFVAAWRNIVSTFRAQGATNVEFTLIMTAYSFRRDDIRSIKHYYPGDAYVDIVAGDAYNFHGCLGIGQVGKWNDLEFTIEPLREWGRQHPNVGLALAEFGSVEDPRVPGRKAQWIDRAHELFKKPGYEQFRAVLYWTGRNQKREHCPFDYATSSSATAALKRMANDPAYITR